SFSSRTAASAWSSSVTTPPPSSRAGHGTGSSSTLRATRSSSPPARDRNTGRSRLVSRFPIEAVVRLDEAHRAGRRAHDDRVRHCPALHVADPAKVVARRDAGRRAHDGTGRELVEAVLPLEVEQPELPALARLVLVARREARLHLAADAEERRGGEDALGSPAAAHED